MPPLWALHAIPFFLLGLVLMYLFAFQLQWLPMFGGYSAGATPGLTWKFVLDVLRHAILPALSIILVSIGGWALAMRGMMVTTMGEDYVVFAEAKGLRAGTVFPRYCVRNAILPQTTGAGAGAGADPVRRGAGGGRSSGIPASARCCSRRSRRTTCS